MWAVYVRPIGGGTLAECILFLYALALIFLLITQHRTLLAVQPANRRLIPGFVWLQLIPVFGLIWQFFVARRISASLRQALSTNHPNLDIGPIFCILTLGFSLYMTYLFYHVFTVNVNLMNINDPPDFDFYLTEVIPYTLLLGALCCCVIYGVSLARIRRRLTRYPTPPAH
jgi:hypothetical protein